MAPADLPPAGAPIASPGPGAQGPGAQGRPLRLLHVYSGNLYGGVERLLETLHACEAACDGENGLRQDFALCFRGRLSDRLRAAGARVADLGPVRRVAPWTALRARRRLAAALQAAATAGEPYDAVLFHAFWPLALLGAGVRRGAGADGRTIPRLLWVHDDPVPTHWTFRGAVRAGADAAIFNSEFVRNRPASRTLLTGLKIPNERAAVIRYPVASPPPSDTSRQAAVRAELGVADDEALILTAARFEPWKGHELLLDALGHLRNDRGWTCAIAGGAQRPIEAKREEDLKARARELGIADRLRWLGHRNDVPDLMAAADLYCQPNLGPEPFGIVFVEALYAGCPVVTTAIGGGREILRAGFTAKAGFAAKERAETTDPAETTEPAETGGRPAAVVGRLTGIDSAAVAEALRDLIADPARRRRLGAAGPARAAALCDPQARLADLQAFCRRVAARSAGPSGDAASPSPSKQVTA